MTAAPDLAGLTPAVTARIAEVARETHDTVSLSLRPAGSDTLSLRPAGNHLLSGFAPGQFSMLYAFGAGELPISISGDPGDRERLTYTIRSVGKASHALASCQPGDYVGVRGPFGTSWPMDRARGGDVLVVAGGIGLAPLRPVMYHIARHRGDYGRLILLYGARTPKALLYRRELRAWSALPDTQVLYTVDYSGMDWHGYVGVVTKLFDFAILRPERTTTMMCGPEIMMRFVVRELQARKFSPSRIYLSMERNMKCAIGLCGHCQMGPYFICKDGPIFSYDQMGRWMEGLREL
jgi:NAD(P)H-flavin reductase